MHIENILLVSHNIVGNPFFGFCFEHCFLLIVTKSELHKLFSRLFFHLHYSFKYSGYFDLIFILPVAEYHLPACLLDECSSKE